MSDNNTKKQKSAAGRNDRDSQNIKTGQGGKSSQDGKTSQGGKSSYSAASTQGAKISQSAGSSSRVLKNLNGNVILTAVLLGLYIAFLAVSYVIVEVTLYPSPVFLILILAGSLAAAYVLLKLLRRAGISWKETKTRRQKLTVFFIAAGVALLVQLIVFRGFAPACISNDVDAQFEQVLANHYYDWHPFWHTLVFYTLPYKITGSFAAITLFQQILYALVFGYMNLVIYDLRDWKAALIMDLLILPNPYVMLYLMYPWKDIGFGLACAMALIMSVRIYAQQKDRPDGTALRNWYLCILGFIAANAVLFRHNGVLFAAPMVLAVMTYIPKRKWIPLLLAFAVTLVAVKVPLASALHMDTPQKRVLETTGLPLTVLGNVAHQNPDEMDEETAEFLYGMAPAEMWENSYITGDFNSIKWDSNTDPVDEKGAGPILSMMFRSFVRAPRAALEGLFALTDLVYGFESGLDGVMGYEVQQNNTGIEYTGDWQTREHILNYSTAVNHSIFHYLFTYGVQLFAVLALILSRLRFKSWKCWKKVFMAFPLLIYDYGTMLLLSGPDFRFFWLTFLTAPVLIIFLLMRDDRDGRITPKPAVARRM